MKIKLKRAAPRNQKRKEFIDWGKLEIPDEREKYLVEVRNRYEVLATEADLQENTDSENQWQCLKNSIIHANETALKVEKMLKKKWITDEIMEVMESRKQAKNTPVHWIRK